eukprot:gnl/Spiro4/2526_TR1215_c0_g1_i1.p2 gnl/Spiro4/2526_TR1215_c0_g1~~gnl/Spiro4/2526_TR1215_c0_g1_i1.p2  ORF type:complete len:104 (-),score=7.02 gnl/Spiro4/2526_TR1215_c0_g1_i1:236-508(-)
MSDRAAPPVRSLKRPPPGAAPRRVAEPQDLGDLEATGTTFVQNPRTPFIADARGGLDTEFERYGGQYRGGDRGRSVIALAFLAVVSGNSE